MYKTTKGAHDPTIIYDEDEKSYYMYSTDTTVDGIMSLGTQIRKSKDMKEWTYIGSALNGIPESVYQYTKPSNLWAPEVVKMNGIYRMYYSASIFGTNESCINLAEANHPEGPWIDRGLVIKSHPKSSEHNAIDANVFKDKHQKTWMVYGSFFSGIHLVRLDETTGKLKHEDDYGICIAKRPLNVEGAIEGPFIYYHKNNDMYYLFTSYDFLGNSYNVRVARSKNVEGPYFDIKGNTMFGSFETPHHNGSKMVGSYKLSIEPHWTSIGHNSVFDKDGVQYLVAHTRIDNKPYPHYAYIRQIHWLNSGWPVLMIAEPIELIEESMVGTYFNIVFFDKTNNKTVTEIKTKIKDTWDVQAYKTRTKMHGVVVGISGIDEYNQMFFGYRKVK